MKLLAISGGVDSMLLANTYKNKNIILVFVNYNVRNDTFIDEEIVTDFAKKNNLILEKLILDGKYPKTNFENWAREIRYDFFSKIYKKYNCNELLIAHHKDDFLETCLMQEMKNKNKLFYGIKQKTTFKSMKINRPFLFKYWKEQIYKLAKKNNLQFHDDYTNFDNNYQRNKIRNQFLANKSIKEKEEMLGNFLLVNRKNEKITKKIKEEYKNWRLNLFNVFYFEKLIYKSELIKIFINKRAKNINLNQKIIENIEKFIKSSKNNVTFMLSDGNYLYKKNNKLYLKK